MNLQETMVLINFVVMILLVLHSFYVATRMKALITTLNNLKNPEELVDEIIQKKMYPIQELPPGKINPLVR